MPLWRRPAAAACALAPPRQPAPCSPAGRPAIAAPPCLPACLPILPGKEFQRQAVEALSSVLAALAAALEQQGLDAGRLARLCEQALQQEAARLEAGVAALAGPLGESQRTISREVVKPAVRAPCWALLRPAVPGCCGLGTPCSCTRPPGAPATCPVLPTAAAVHRRPIVRLASARHTLPQLIGRSGSA